ncbi:MAG: N-acetylmuramic acid 6-phosphate etherase [Usitatibacter sp.]
MATLETETPHPDHPRLDEYDTRKLVDVLIQDQSLAAEAVMRASRSIEAAVNAAVPRLEAGGRLIYVGAGTSGRLGLLDSVELYPTFSWPPERAVAILAGGNAALFRAVEGAEDDRKRGAQEFLAVNPTRNDVVLLLAASGVTPYTRGAVEAARSAGALTIGIGNNSEAPIALEAEIGILLETGYEIISGSTRLKAGTAQKIALNTFSSAVMVRLHKVYGNLMVDLKPTNAKLKRRALQLAMLATGANEGRALAMLEECDFHVKVAIVAITRNVTPALARDRLATVNGSVRAALGD